VTEVPSTTEEEERGPIKLRSTGPAWATQQDLTLLKKPPKIHKKRKAKSRNTIFYGIIVAK
jgi:hypothetical protein